MRRNRRSACQSLTRKRNTTPAHLGVKSPRPRMQACVKRGFTIGFGRSKAGVDETKGLITGPEPFAYPPKRQDRQTRVITCSATVAQTL